MIGHAGENEGVRHAEVEFPAKVEGESGDLSSEGMREQAADSRP